jgi:hypothetical protein
MDVTEHDIHLGDVFNIDGIWHQESISQEQNDNQHIYTDVLHHLLEDAMKRS